MDTDQVRGKWDATKGACPTRQVLDCIADKWSVLIIGCLMEKSRRSGELRREIEGVSQKMLTQTLRALERDGLISRDVFPSVPPKVEYALTPLGSSLAQVVDRLREWSEQNVEHVISSQKAFDAGLTSSAR